MAPTVGRQGVHTKELSMLIITRNNRGFSELPQYHPMGEPMTESEVREIAAALGYELKRTPQGFQLIREFPGEEEVVESPSLQPLLDYLSQ